MLTVACVYWKGEFGGISNIYNPEYVEKLYSMVKRNLTIPFRFVCLTNDFETEVSYERIPLKNNWEGWWSKIELFRPGLFSGRVMYIDLDTLIIKDLDSIVNFPSPFVTSRTMISFEEPSVVSESEYRSGKARVKRNGRWEVFMYNSSVMVWDVSPQTEQIYKSFKPELIDTYRGDQDYLADAFPLADIFPKSWIRKLKEVERTIPTDCHILLCTPVKNEQLLYHYKLVNEIWK